MLRLAWSTVGNADFKKHVFATSGVGMLRSSWLIGLLIFTACGCSRERPSTLADGNYDVQEMDAAIARARSEVESFIQELEHPTGMMHAVKAPIEDDGQVEHFWLTDLKYEDGNFKGTINNDPGIVHNVKIGQAWSVGKNEISDWMFMKDNKMHGNYTMRPLLKTLPPEEAEKMRAILAEP